MTGSQHLRIDLQRSHSSGLMRWIAVLCMLLIMVASTVELCHNHTDPIQASKIRQQNENGQQQNQNAPTDHCPLCVAMHSALPSALHVAPEPVMLMGVVTGAQIDTRRRLLWAHGLSSRPPPVVKTIAT